MNKAAACMLLLFAALPARSANEAEAERGKLIALENAWNQAQMRKDAGAVEQLLGRNFIYTDYDGQVMDRAQFLQDMKDPAYRASSIVGENFQVFPYRSTAVVAGTYRTRGTYKGKPFEHHGRFTDTWVYDNGTWVCVASHISLMKQ
ncbi:MAG TPA: nuclear transport factor 2 family protein [Terriglobales bacterium]|nr:nuclear transport factor 2 family protein [Terriglobales bacterium]